MLTRTGSADWPAGLGTPVTLPAGWEPLEASPFGGMTGTTVTVGALVVVRHCQSTSM